MTDEALKPQTTLRDYAIKRVLGRGSFGITYLAEQLSDHAIVAIKEYFPADIAERDADGTTVNPSKRTTDPGQDFHSGLEKFLEESRVLSGFNNPHIVRVVDSFELHGTAYMVMRYEEGATLARYLHSHQKPLDEGQILSIFIPLLEGLRAIHAKWLLHRDIKPENIYIRQDGSPLLIDFGTARHALSVKQGGMTEYLTPGYAPPEQYDRHADHGPWTDLYAVGATMYNCVTRIVPPEGRSRTGGEDPVMPAVQAAPAFYDRQLLEVIDWMMAPDTEARPQSVDDVLERLEALRVREAEDIEEGQEELAATMAQAGGTDADDQAGDQVPIPTGGTSSLPEEGQPRAASAVDRTEKLDMTPQGGGGLRSGRGSSTAWWIAGVVTVLFAVATGLLINQNRSDAPAANAGRQPSAEPPEEATLVPEAPARQGEDTAVASEPEGTAVARKEPESSVAKWLKECRAHMEATRLTTGAGGNAFDCYQKVLGEDPGNAVALAGLKEIQDTYEAWIRGAIENGNETRAQNILERLERLNPDNPAIPELSAGIATLERRKQEAAARRRIESQLQACREHFSASRLTTGEGGNAFDCYQQVLEEDPGNDEALAGLARIEEEYASRVGSAIQREEVAEARGHLKTLARVNPDSSTISGLQSRITELERSKEEEAARHRLEAQLATCRDHLSADRLTTGKEGNAFDCYQQVLEEDPGNDEALAGLEQIEETYASWARSALEEGDTRKAASNLAKLQKLDPEHPIFDEAASPPQIELIEPAVTLLRSGDYAAVVDENTGSREVLGEVVAPVGVSTLQINGQAVDVDENGLFNALVPIAGAKTSVSIAVVDGLGRRASLSFDLLRQSTETVIASAGEDGDEFPYISGLGDYHALVIGNGEYADFPSLPTAKNDAQAVAEVLKNRYGYETKLLLDATRYEILAALNEYRSDLASDDNLLIYYSGHGEIDAVNDNGYWLPVDSEKDNTANWISTRSISEILNVMDAKHVLVVADSCYSGALTRSALARLSERKTREEWIQWFNKVGKMRTRMVLTAGGEQPVDIGAGHSLFTGAFLDALEENDSIVDGYRLFSSVADAMKQTIESEKLNTDAHAEYAPIKYAGHEAGEFIFQPLNAGKHPSPARHTKEPSKCEAYIGDGKVSDAAKCYYSVLDVDPGNKQALAGLKKLEDLLMEFAHSQFRSGELSKEQLEELEELVTQLARRREARRAEADQDGK